MYEIVAKRKLAPKIISIRISADEVAKKAKPGQFVILRLGEKGERIPLTIANHDIKKGTITVVFHEVGNTTKKMGSLEEGDFISDVVGPLGNPAEIEEYGTILCVGGGIWVAPLHFEALALREKGNNLITVVGARTKDLLILEEEMKEISDEFYIATDDGSKGYEGFDFLKEVLETKKIDRAIVMGPVVMMQTFVEITRPYGLKTMVTLAPIMLDGMGMCGACRVSVGGKTKFACMDGPEFDGHLVDFEQLIRRQRLYLPEERISSMLREKLGGIKRG
ncbi:MAG: sulfide/dihydroorotate dehydrogenase-like FAD/NAD-binding protein [Candidatus Bathyarchaeota archaeon]|nr:MAG: sulfide/dihydroorotate dehydrogenase-like FAD/NAD-binding protein [Candidatus Bathyarchaeota archaeon]UCE57756.1 MAG: sulfide/dihydroorotate dehydrogenase-like FAD/NAD-binding protein [Candidatus Bathyarchaeota archaeon]